MAMGNDTAHGVHLVGSVPLGSADEVFRSAATLGGRLRRVPDGETGVRSDWISWQLAVLERTPGLEIVPAVQGGYSSRPHVRLVSAGAADAPRFGTLGYAAAAIASYDTFARLKREGILPPYYRFQVSLPTPLAVITAFVERGDRAAVEPAYERRLLSELSEIAAVIPHGQLAIQWDVALEIGILERVIPSHLTDPEADIVERLVRLGEHAPADIELGYHLCYGDSGHRHFKQPADIGLLVRVANTLASSVRRPIQWVHMPVPRDRAADAYFAPLRTFALSPTTELYLGLVHLTDGVVGTRQRVAVARSSCHISALPPSVAWAGDRLRRFQNCFRSMRR